ncbi:MAG: hypothetical protein K8I29_13835 [Alphaproteobacteria bacterium]|uniref:DUF1460 domain-containing protein n=1 Tax=Candidatus Nitrobium versatile TaxID=2884831 RepID=A0A953M265_9BACT|nr:hypothetical protein [Candidatus Nitrobium versatile]
MRYGRGAESILARIVLLLLLFAAVPASGLTLEEINALQSEVRDRPLGERIALFAEKFVGTPYDPDPRGAYVTGETIVADGEVDCMYLVFRAVELALSSTPEEAVRAALDKRFVTAGVLVEGRVSNYEDRFAYGEDMIKSGKWGRDITAEIGKTVRVRKVRDGDYADILPPRELLGGMEKLRSGDIIFFTKTPGKEVAGELVGHLGIVITEKLPHPGIYVIHASGKKGKGGAVKKVSLKEYLKKMPFAGAKITRF